MSKERVIIVFDGSHLLHRMRFVTPEEYDWKFYVFNFIKGLYATVKELWDYTDGGYIGVVAWDKSRSLRYQLEGGEVYKAHRKWDEADKTLEYYRIARELLHNTLPKLGWYSVLKPGVEADDIPYLLHNYTRGYYVIGVSSDSDWILSDATYNPIKKDFQVNLLPDDVVRTWLKKAATGDADFPGIHGIGEKRSEAFVKEVLSGELGKWSSKILKESVFWRNLGLVSMQVVDDNLKEYKELLGEVPEFSMTEIGWLEFSRKIESETLFSIYDEIVNKSPTPEPILWADEPKFRYMDIIISHLEKVKGLLEMQEV